MVRKRFGTRFGAGWACAALLAMAVPTAASSLTTFPLEHTISLVWESTGTNDLTLSSSSSGRETLYVVLDAGNFRVFGADLSFVFDASGADELDFVASREVASLSNNLGTTLFQESGPGQEGLLIDFDVVFPGGLRNQTITLGSIVFDINGGALANGFDITPVVLGEEFGDGVWNNAHRDISTLYPGKVAFVGASVQLPEPTTASLLISGVALLIWAGRTNRERGARP